MKIEENFEKTVDILINPEKRGVLISTTIISGILIAANFLNQEFLQKAKLDFLLDKVGWLLPVIFLYQ